METPQSFQPIYLRIRSHIHAKGIPLYVVASKAGIQPKRFYRLMDGKTKLRADEVEQICSVEVLELNPAVLLCPTVLKN